MTLVTFVLKFQQLQFCLILFLTFLTIYNKNANLLIKQYVYFCNL